MAWDDIPKSPYGQGGFEVPGDAARWPSGDGYQPYDDHHWPINDVEMLVVTLFILCDRMGYQPGVGEHPGYPGAIVDDYGRADWITTAPTRAGDNYWAVIEQEGQPTEAFFRTDYAGVDPAYHRCFMAIDDDGYAIPVALSGPDHLLTSGFFFVDRGGRHDGGGGYFYGLIPLIQPPWSWHVWNSVRGSGIPT